MRASEAEARTIADRIPPHAYFVVSAVFHYLGPSFAVLLFAAIEPLGVAWLRIASAAVVFALWRRPLRRIDAALPPHVYFLISALFHYLGPAFAVLLFAEVDVLGVAWLRIATATAIFAAWRRPWRLLKQTPRPDLRLIGALGLVLGAMNAVFYLALDRLPLGTVGAIEFLGPIALAASATRSGRNLAALGLAVGGVGLLADVRLAGEPLGFALAGINAALFVLYVVLAHRAARSGVGGIDCLAAAMVVAMVVVSPVGLNEATSAFSRPEVLLAGIGVGVCSSVIPYVSDQLAMARLSRAAFAFLLALLPACATAIGVVVLRQIPSLPEIAGVGLIVGGVALRREPAGDVASSDPPDSGGTLCPPRGNKTRIAIPPAPRRPNGIRQVSDAPPLADRHALTWVGPRTTTVSGRSRTGAGRFCHGVRDGDPLYPCDPPVRVPRDRSQPAVR